jgi:type III pantothenate kinase
VTPDVVVDVGNSRMKWGRCVGGEVAEIDAVPVNLASVWASRFDAWGGAKLSWAVAGSNPERRDAFGDWLRERGCRVTVFTDWKQIGQPVKLPYPDRVGHDRLLNARAGFGEIPPGQPAVMIDAGTTVTVDLLDETGAFAGGAIFPGVGVMSRSLQQFTAKLPLVPVETSNPPVPGDATEPAIRAGIWWAVVGGITAIVDKYRERRVPPALVLLTGGDAELLLPGLDFAEHRPHLTLEGIRIAAEALP